MIDTENFMLVSVMRAEISNEVCNFYYFSEKSFYVFIAFIIKILRLFSYNRDYEFQANNISC